MNIGDEIISSGGHIGYITKISHDGIDAISGKSGAMLSIRKQAVYCGQWKPTGNSSNKLKQVIEEITGRDYAVHGSGNS